MRLIVITIGATTGIQIRANDGGNLTAANLTLGGAGVQYKTSMD